MRMWVSERVNGTVSGHGRNVRPRRRRGFWVTDPVDFLYLDDDDEALVDRGGWAEVAGGSVQDGHSAGGGANK